MFSQIAKITDSLYLSSAMAVSSERLRQHNITHVINITMEIPSLDVPGVHFTKVMIDDAPHADLAAHFTRLADHIKWVEDSGGKTLVHCIAGVSRSSSTVLAYLMRHKQMTLKQAFVHVKSKRPVIRPNMGFWKQLIAYEQALMGRNSVHMVQSPLGWIPDVYSEEARAMVW